MRTTPTFQCLTKPILLAGCERDPFIIMACGAGLFFVTAWFAWSLFSLLAGVFVFCIVIPLLRYAAKQDPLMTQVARRYFSYQKHYAPYPTLQAPRARPPGPIIAYCVLSVAVLVAVWFVL